MTRIQGLNDSASLTGRNMAPVGFDVHKGAEMVRGETMRDNRIGRNLDYFRIVPRPGFEKYVPSITALLGPQPRSIARVYMVGDVDQCLDARYVERLSTGFTRRTCNGAMIISELGPNGFDFTPKPCLKNTSEGCKCRRRATLYFYLPELAASTGIVFLFAFGTGSAEEIRNLTGQLEFCTQAANGQLWRIPFTLFRRTEKVPRIGKDNQPMMVEESRVHLLGNLAGVFGLPAGDTPILPSLTNGHDQSPIDEPDELPEPGNDPARAEPAPDLKSYWIFFSNMVAQRLGITIEDLLDACGCESSDGFLKRFVNLTQAQDALRDLVIDQQMPVRADRVEISHVRNNPNNRIYTFDVDFCQVTAGERKAFIEAGYITEADWTNTGRIRIETGVVFTIKRNIRKTAKTAYYTVDQVFG